MKLKDFLMEPVSFLIGIAFAFAITTLYMLSRPPKDPDIHD